MKKITYVLIVFGLFVSCNFNNDSVKIGAVYPMTGNGAQYGEYFRQGTELAYTYAIQEELIDQGDVEIIIEDGQGNATASISAFNSLLNRDISAALIDLSSVILPIKPIANRNQVVAINSSSFSSEIEDSDDYMFSVLPNAEEYGRLIAEYSFNEMDKRNAAVVYRNDPMGISFNESFIETFEGLGGNVIYSDSHEMGAQDYRTHVLKLREIDNLDIIFGASYGVEVAYFVKQARELNLNAPFITFQSFFIEDVFEIAGNAANGVTFLASSFSPSNQDSLVSKVNDLFNEKFGEADFNYYAAAHFDATMILLEAISEGHNTGSEIRNFIKERDVFEGITGTIDFNQNGLASIPLSPYETRNGQFVKIK